MKLSIIIPSYNMSNRIKDCLDSILNSTADKNEYEIIIFDSSSDESPEIFKKYVNDYWNVRLIRSNQKTTCGTARNYAVEKAMGEYIYFVDIDDVLVTENFPKIIDRLDGTTDVFFCPYKSLKDNSETYLRPKNISEMARECPTGMFAKIYKREFFVPFPDYMPEGVVQHFLVLDRCQTVDYFDFVCYVYDNRNEHISAISRTFDHCRTHPYNLIQLAVNNTIPKLELRDEYISGVIHNLAHMYECRNMFHNKDVKNAFIQRFFKTYQMISSGFFIH